MIPVIITVFNQETYLKNIINQLNKLNLNDLIILDSGSSHPSFKSYLSTLKSASVITLKENLGPRHFYENKDIYNSLPDNFIVTDPDLDFNKDLPQDFLNDLIDLSEKYEVGKVGFALSISKTEDIFEESREWEEKYWKKIVGETRCGDKIFKADIDTTFALYNKKYIKNTSFPGDFFKALRVAGRFTAKHWGWYKEQPIPESELNYYKNFQKWSFTETQLNKN